MKNNLILVTILLASFFSSVAFGDEKLHTNRVGMYGGAGFAFTRGPGESGYVGQEDDVPRFAGVVGIDYIHLFGTSFGLNAGAAVVGKGFRGDYDDTPWPELGNYVQKTQYLEVPLGIGIYISNLQFRTQLFLAVTLASRLIDKENEYDEGVEGLNQYNFGVKIDMMYEFKMSDRISVLPGVLWSHHIFADHKYASWERYWRRMNVMAFLAIQYKF